MRITRAQGMVVIIGREVVAYGLADQGLGAVKLTAAASVTARQDHCRAPAESIAN